MISVLAVVLVLASACGGGGASSTGADGVEVFGAASPVAVTGDRAMNLGDIRVNITMEDQWQVALRDVFSEHGSAFYVIQPHGTSGTVPALQFLRPSNLVEVADLSNALESRPDGGTIDLSNSFDLEAWIAMLPSDVEVSPRQSVQFAGMDSVTFDIEVGTSVCDSDCSFLLVEPNGSGTGAFSFAGLAAEERYSIIWTDRGSGQFPIVILMSGSDAFVEEARVVVNSAEIGAPPAEA